MVDIKDRDQDLSLSELRRELELVKEDLGCIARFSQRLLLVLQSTLEIHDDELDRLLTTERDEVFKLTDSVGRSRTGPCPVCGRPLLEHSKNCIFCGKKLGAQGAAPNAHL